MKLLKSLIFVTAVCGQGGPPQGPTNPDCNALDHQHQCEQSCNRAHKNCADQCTNNQCHDQCRRDHQACYNDCPCHQNCWTGCPCSTYDGCPNTNPTDPSPTDGPTDGPGEDDSKWALSNADLAKFNCRRTDAWQLPQSCGTNCRESDKTYFNCESSLTVDPNNENFLIFESVGIPDHNACAKPPKSTIGKSDYKFRIPREPKLKGLNDSYRSNNMGEVGFGFNGVAIFNPYDRYCCDAGLYELSALDMCYAHPNGDRGSRYHYHVWSPCLSTCTGESELIGIALDGFPIYGPGINPDTGKVWSQSDMDLCGGRQDKNGKYAYYTTVDFPYMLQCYRGHTDQTENLVTGRFEPQSNCGFFNENCAHPHLKVTDKNITDPTEQWIDRAFQVYSQIKQPHTYIEEHILRKAKRTRRSAAELERAIDEYLNGDGSRSPLSKDDFLDNLLYDCNECNGGRDLVTSCNGMYTNSCTGAKTEEQWTWGNVQPGPGL